MELPPVVESDVLALSGVSDSVVAELVVGSVFAPAVEDPDFACVEGDGKDLEPGKVTALGRRVIGFVGAGEAVRASDCSVTTSELEGSSVDWLTVLVEIAVVFSWPSTGN